jgi:sugar transferase (PEP-CTERM system associated)
VIDGISFYESLTGNILVENLRPSWLIFSQGFKKTPARMLSKRLFGMVISFCGIVVTLPLSLLAALCIKLDSPGPIFYPQVRCGEKGKLFTLYKFRSMNANAEKETGAVWAQENDPRITKVGRIIRTLRIDEIPQMWNVLRGDMSFVGPRPERPEFVGELKELIPFYEERMHVKPGITGWAQVCREYGASIEDALEKLQYDLYYIKNMNFLFDLRIIFETVKIILLGRGAR